MRKTVKSAFGVNALQLLIKTVLYFRLSDFLVKLNDDSSFCRILSMNNQQSEEFLSNHQSEEDDSFYSIPQIEGFCSCENLQKQGIFLITSNLRKLNMVFILKSDSSECSILLHKKYTKWGIFFDILQSEEFAIFNAIRDSPDCRISFMLKATI